MIYDYPFTEEEAKAAYDEWQCNCGPAALAFALGMKLDAVRGAIPDFDKKHYTSPSMMKAALANLGGRFDSAVCPSPAGMFVDTVSLVRLQWSGPWTAPGANPKWAYRHTHWIATWTTPYNTVFDVNGGIMAFHRWEKEIVPLIVATIPRADGGYFPTHIWRLNP